MAVWQTKPLESDVTIAGDVIADLFASTSGTDSDWIVKLIDVYPPSVPEDPPMGGYELMIGADVLRGRFRNGFEKPEPVDAEPAGRVSRRSAIARPRVPEGPSHHDSGSEHLVSDHRPESADVCAEHLRGERIRLSSCDTACLSIQDAPFGGDSAGGSVTGFQNSKRSANCIERGSIVP